MKTTAIKIKILFILSAMFGVFGAFAQYQFDPGKSTKKQAEWMKTELSLSDEQTAKVKNINLSYAKKSKELREQMHQQMKSLELDKQKELGNVLTKEQVSKYKINKVEKKEQWKQRRVKGKQERKGQRCIQKEVDK